MNKNKHEQFITRKRNQTLLLVEGKHEKNEMFHIFLECFPELPIRIENIHVYHADIYDLYWQIEKEYDENWFENKDEINIPLLISKRFHINPPLDKRDFVNIILMFDYERHDNFYSNEKIRKMQEHFNDATEDGILYINYPMIESYQHIVSIPDDLYLERYIPVTCNPGSKYKNLVHENSYIWKYLVFYNKLYENLTQRLPDMSKEHIEIIRNRILYIQDKDKLLEEIGNIFVEFAIDSKVCNTLKYSISHQIFQLDYINNGMNFWSSLRKIIIYTALQNIQKAWKIQNNVECIEDKTLKTMYLELDYLKILEEQNKVSQDSMQGIIWILCMCITFFGEYKFFWN